GVVVSHVASISPPGRAEPGPAPAAVTAR
ncbi:MAG: hypothetical protein JWM18_3837, partial [Chloroflexi bacterium]|nr:hypothetical protein [Chloroflexota bacterium]